MQVYKDTFRNWGRSLRNALNYGANIRNHRNHCKNPSVLLQLGKCWQQAQDCNQWNTSLVEFPFWGNEEAKWQTVWKSVRTHTNKCKHCNHLETSLEWPLWGNKSSQRKQCRTNGAYIQTNCRQFANRSWAFRAQNISLMRLLDLGVLEVSDCTKPLRPPFPS